MIDAHQSQRGYFAYYLQKEMRINPNIYLLVGDLGYLVFDKCFEEFPDRCYNVGAAEQTMLDIAVGLAYDGKIPFCYSITPFLLYRPFETIRTYVDHENLNVKLVGSGRNTDYAHDGASHDATDVGLYLNNLQNIKQYFPKEKEELKDLVSEITNNGKPSFISLTR